MGCGKTAPAPSDTAPSDAATEGSAPPTSLGVTCGTKRCLTTEACRYRPGSCDAGPECIPVVDSPRCRTLLPPIYLCACDGGFHQETECKTEYSTESPSTNEQCSGD